MTTDIVIDAIQAASTSTFDATLIVLIAAVAVSLLIGIGSIVLTKNIESRKYKYELFKEMVDWLESVIKCGGEICLRFMQTKKITPSEEKSITEEAIAKYLLVTSKTDFILEIADSAGFPSELFGEINDGITDVMTAINKQLDTNTVNVFVLYNEKIMPLNNKCSGLMGIIAKTLSREVKLKRSELKLLNGESNNTDESINS